MGATPQEVKFRHIHHCFQADPAYGEGVADAPGIALSEVGQDG
jgi:catalase